MKPDEIKVLRDIVNMYGSEFGKDGRYEEAIIILKKENAAQQYVQRTADNVRQSCPIHGQDYTQRVMDFGCCVAKIGPKKK